MDQNNLRLLRETINRIDAEMEYLFEKRMKCAAAIAEYKHLNNIPVQDEEREQELIERNSALVRNEAVREYYVSFLKKTIDLSCAYQKTLVGKTDGTV